MREKDSLAPEKIGRYRQPLLAGQETLLRELTTTRKGITLTEIRDELLARGIGNDDLVDVAQARLDLTCARMRLDFW